MWYWHGSNEWGWVSMAIMMLMFWVPLIAAGAWFLSRLGAGGRERTGNEASQVSARELADRRYARGELSREQYLQVIADLGGRGGATRA